MSSSASQPSFPSGTVTLLFTDIEGSTRLWEEHPDAMRPSLALHDALVRGAIESAGGHVFKTVGDAFCAAFERATDAATAAVQIQSAMLGASWTPPVEIRVRVGLHTGECDERDGDYFGPTVNRVARLEAAAHGGQIVVSCACAEMLDDAPGMDLTDLGLHRLKDLGRPERVSQLNAPGPPVEFPPLRSLDNPALLHNLPAQTSTFVGRVHELADVARLVEANRLVTISGAGGAGKTRLALQAGADLLDGAGGGVWFVDLTGVSEPEKVASAAAAALGVVEELGRGTGDVIAEAIGTRLMLIVLDNCEHVVDASAKLADQLLRSCPNVHVLATSRQPLGLAGEQVYRVPPLSLPAVEGGHEELSGSEAVQLFVNRARLARPTFNLDESNAPIVAALCRRLDGIPLAIELAAARLRTLSPADVVDRLEHRFQLLTGGSRAAMGRHRTLHALVDWSYDLLNEPEQHVFGRLSVFVSGFTLEAVEAVCGDDEGPFEVTDLVGGLVDQSLVEFEPEREPSAPRYRLLETIREFATERMAERPAPDQLALRARHARAYLALAEKAAPCLRGPELRVWGERLEREHDNLLAALAQLEREGDGESAIRLALALDYFWRVRGRLSEGVETTRRLIDEHGAAAPPRLRAAIEVTQGALSLRSGDHPAARRSLKSALALSRAEGFDAIAADALGELAYLEGRLGNYDASLTLADEAVELARRAGDLGLVSENLDVRAFARDLSGVAGARDDWNESIELARTSGNVRLTAIALNNVAGIDMRELDLAGARVHLQGSLDIARLLGSEILASTVLTNLGAVAVMVEDFAAASAEYREALEIARRIGMRPNVAYALNGLALCRSADGELALAAALHGAADALFKEIGETLDPQEDGIRTQDIERLRAADGAAFDGGYSRGRALPLDDAVRLALESVQRP